LADEATPGIARRRLVKWRSPFGDNYTITYLWRVVKKKTPYFLPLLIAHLQHHPQFFRVNNSLAFKRKGEKGRKNNSYPLLRPQAGDSLKTYLTNKKYVYKMIV
jgi:hypothetical protein